VYRYFFLITSFVLGLASGAQGQGISVIELQRVFKAKALAGIVTFAGQPVPGALVEECTPGWKDQVAVTQTDDKGHFRLPRGETKGVHYLRVSWRGANPVWFKVRIVRRAKDLVVNLTPST